MTPDERERLRELLEPVEHFVSRILHYPDDDGIVMSLREALALLDAQPEPHPDTVRLDWLADHEGALSQDGSGEGWTCHHMDGHAGPAPTPRDAIDAARAKGEKP